MEKKKHLMLSKSLSLKKYHFYECCRIKKNKNDKDNKRPNPSNNYGNAVSL